MGLTADVIWRDAKTQRNKARQDKAEHGTWPRRPSVQVGGTLVLLADRRLAYVCCVFSTSYVNEESAIDGVDEEGPCSEVTLQ